MPTASTKRRLLVGPFVEAGLSDYMVGAFDDFDTITFGSLSGVDIEVPGLPSLKDILDLLPPDWAPDYLILWRPEYGYIPIGVEHSICPVAMLVSDWYLAFSDSLEAAWRVDLIVTGTRGEAVFRAAGFDHVLAMPMLGYQPEIDGQFGLSEDQRDIDVYLGGNPNWVIHKQRELIIGELLDLPQDRTIFHGRFVDRQHYNELLGRSKIVVNQTVIGEINMKVYEVCAAGSCLFVEEDNLDISDYLVPDESVVLFNRVNLREKVEYYLAHDDLRRKMAAAAQRSMARYTYRENFRHIVERMNELNEAGHFAAQRSCFELSPTQRAEGMLGYSLRHNGGDLLAPVALGEDPTLKSNRAQLLRAAAHYFARLGSGSDSEDNPQANDPIWATPKIIKSFQQSYLDDPNYLPAAYCWARVAAAHLDASVALPMLEKVASLLLDGCEIPFSGADFFFWDPDTQYDFERKAWEALERGEPLGEGLRPMILEDVLVVAAQLAVNAVDDSLAKDALELAIEHHPQGGRARPLLAEAMASEGQWSKVAEIWREHLQICPLHLGAYEGLLEAARQSENLEVTDEERRRYDRAKEVLLG